jgi:hypothetical protein
MDRSARTNGKRFACPNFVSAESWSAYLDITLLLKTLVHAELRLGKLLLQGDRVHCWTDRR